jgi:predicted phosphoribosyltransferase
MTNAISLPFQDRFAGGRALAALLSRYAGRNDVLILALPRGGVPVAYEIARALQAPLDVLLVRKLGVPGHEELAMGALASGGTRVLHDSVIYELNIPDEVIERVSAREQQELERREQLFRAGRPPLDVSGRVVILVDDGLATGSTMRAGAQALRQMKPEKLVIAVPVGAEETCASLASAADEVVCVATPHPFHAVGLWYEEFPQNTDDEVCALLARAQEEINRDVKPFSIQEP